MEALEASTELRREASTELVAAMVARRAVALTRAPYVVQRRWRDCECQTGVRTSTEASVGRYEAGPSDSTTPGPAAPGRADVDVRCVRTKRFG
jgi:hypothetical protein